MPEEHDAQLSALIEAFEAMPGHSDSADLDDVIRLATRYGFTGDRAAATELLKESTSHQVVEETNPVTGENYLAMQAGI